MGYTFMVPAKIISGVNVISELGDHICGQRLQSSNRYRSIHGQIRQRRESRRRAEKSQLPYVIFDGANTEPTDKIVEAGLKVYRDENCDFIIALGGGEGARHGGRQKNQQLHARSHRYARAVPRCHSDDCGHRLRSYQKHNHFRHRK